MKFKNLTLKKLCELVCGNDDVAPYLTANDLLEFFGELGFNDKFKEARMRYTYVEKRLTQLIEEERFIDVVNELLAPIRYLDTDKSVNKVLKRLNQIISTEGYEVVKGTKKGKYVLSNIQTATIVVKKEDLKILSSEFLIDQIDKCNRKLECGDLYGAITNARSMLEEVLLAIEEDVTGERGKNTGDISTVYKRVAKLINFDAGKDGLATPLRQILTGLNSIVIGVANLRTKASDSHAPEYKPEKHHAELAVNAAMTFTKFILNSYMYQKGKLSN